MRVLVVGGTGFIGGHAARALRDCGNQVTAFVRDAGRARMDERLDRATIVEGRVGAPPKLERHDVVVYAVGAWKRDDKAREDEIEGRCREAYVDGVRSLSDMACAWGAHFILLSSHSRYGSTPASRVSEESPPGPLTSFGAYKRDAERMLEAAPRLRWTAVVPPEVYGSHDRGGWVHFLYRRIRARRFIVLGRGDNRWSVCNVQNLADAIVTLAPGEGQGVVNIADRDAVSQRDLAAAVARALGRAPRFLRVPRSVALAAAAVNVLVPRGGLHLTPSAVRIRTAERILDTSKAKRLGIVPRASLDEGIAAAVDFWERDHKT